MKEEWVRPWVDALRSGEYKQGTKKLRSSTNKFCCLGVLCDLVAQQNENMKWGNLDFRTKSYFFDDGTNVTRCTLPPEVLYVTGIKNIEGAIFEEDPHHPQYGSLTDFNDAGMSFNEIADLIEHKWKLL